MNIQDILNYFGYPRYSIIKKNGGMDDQFFISGKTTKGNLKIYLIFIIFCVLSYFIMCKSMTEFIITLILLFTSMIVLFIHHKIIFKKLEVNLKSFNLYQRELPSNLKPAHVRILLHDGLIDKISLGATLLDLINRNFLKIVKVEHEKNIFSEKNNIIIKRGDKDCNELLEFERFLIDWFFSIAGNNDILESNILREKLNFMNNALDYFNDFKSLVILSFPVNIFYNDLRKNKDKYTIIYSIILLFGLFAFIISPYFIILPVYGLGGLLFLNPSYVINKQGKSEQDNWLSLKKFLHDFSSDDNKTIEMQNIWDYYLTYLVALDENELLKDQILHFFGSNVDQSSSNNANSFQKSNFSIDRNNIQIIVEDELRKYNYHSFL